MQIHRSILLVAGLALSATLVAAKSASQDDFHFARTILQAADRMANDALSNASGQQDECDFVAGLAMNASILSLRADLAEGIASCVNEESGTPAKFRACLQELFEEFSESLVEVLQVHDERLDLCDLTGGGIYDPDLDEDEFIDGVDHELLPYKTGAIWVYEGLTDEGLEVVTVTVTGETICIDDIECIVVNDVVTLEDELIEDTDDWYAQHEDGAVWYLGEIVQNFEEGVLVDLDGSFTVGEDGALPGIVMLADPTVGVTYRQEFAINVAEDAGTVIADNVTVTIGLGTFTGCLQTADFTPLEPGSLEFKYYAPNVGLVLEEKPSTGERLELIAFTPGS